MGCKNGKVNNSVFLVKKKVQVIINNYIYILKVELLILIPSQALTIIFSFAFCPFVIIFIFTFVTPSHGYHRRSFL
jgi:hypothetical protein